MSTDEECKCCSEIMEVNTALKSIIQLWTDDVLISSRSGILFPESAKSSSMQFRNYIHFGLQSLQSFFEGPRTKTKDYYETA